MLAQLIIEDVCSQKLCVGRHTSMCTVAWLHLPSDSNGYGTAATTCCLHYQGTVSISI